jgi:hypothetical protein
MALNFESVVSDKDYWEKLVSDNWFKIQRHLPSYGVNLTSKLYQTAQIQPVYSIKNHTWKETKK